MADNVNVTAGSGTTIAADEIGGVKYQRVKIGIGADGAASDLAYGQTTTAGSLPVVIASDQTVIPAAGAVAHDAADSGNPLKIGGKAATSTPTAVSNSDRVDAWFDANGRLIVDINSGGSVAHDAADAGNPIKIGGKALTNYSVPAAVNTGDRVDAHFNQHGQLCVDANNGPVAHDGVDYGTPLKIGGKASSSTPTAVANADRVNAWFDVYGRLNVTVHPAYKRVSISPGDPMASASSDITQVDGTDVEAADFTIRDTAAHRFYIPMAKSDYRTAVIYVENDAVAWDQVPSIKLYGCMNTGGGYIGALLLSITGVVTASNRIAIGIGSAGVGGRIGTATVPGTYYWYQCDAIAAGWEYLELAIQFSSAPSQGEIDDIVVVRQG